MTASLDLRVGPATTDAAPWTDPSRYWPRVAASGSTWVASAWSTERKQP